MEPPKLVVPFNEQLKLRAEIIPQYKSIGEFYKELEHGKRLAPLS